MRNFKLILTVAAALAIGILVLAAGTAGAATRYWDGGTTDIGTDGDGASQGGVGTWNETILNWDQGAGLPHVAWVNANIDDAVFAGGGYNSVALGSPITVGNLTLLGSGDKHFSGSVLTLDGSGGIAGTPLITWVGNGNFSCAVAGTKGFTITGSGNPGFNSSSGNTISGPGYLTGNVQFRLKTSTLAIQNVTSLTVNDGAQLYVESSNGDRTYSTPLFMNSSSTNAIRFATNITWAGDITLQADTNISTNNAASTITGTISESVAGRALIKRDTNTLTFAAANTYTGLTSVLGGTLAYGIDNAILDGGITVNSATGKLDIGSYSDTVGRVTLTNGTIAGTTGVLTSTEDFAVVLGTASANLSGAVGLTKTGTGLVVLSGDNVYTGATTVNAGTLQFNSPSAIAGTGRNVVVGANTMAAGYAMDNDFLKRIDNSTQPTGAIALAADSSENLDFSASGADLTTASLGAVGTVSYTGTLTPNAGTYRLGGGGTLVMPNANTLTSGNSLVVAGGTVLLTASNSVDGSTTINSGATLQLGSGLTGKNGSVASASIVDNGTLAFNNADAQSSANVISGSGALTKSGAGTLTLTGANIYSGATTITASTLVLSGAAGAITGTSGLTLNGGTLELVNADSTEGAVNRFRNDRDITGNSGTFKYTNTVGTGETYAEQIRNFTSNSGQTDIILTNDMTPGGNTQTLTMGTLARNNRSAITFSSPAGLDATTNAVITTSAATAAGQIFNPGVTVGTAPNAQTDYAFLVAATANRAVVAANIAASTQDTWTTPANAYTMGGDETLTATRTIYALRYSGAGNTLDLGANNLETYGILNGSTGLLTINGTGAVKQQGVAATNLFLTAGSGDILINAPVTNNTGDLALVKSGAGTVTLNGGTTLGATNGRIDVNAGTLAFTGSAAVTTTGAVTVNGGGTLTQSAATFAGGGLTVGSAGTSPAGMTINSGTVSVAGTNVGGPANSGDGGSFSGHTLNITGGSFTTTAGSQSSFNIAYNANNTATLNVSGAGTTVTTAGTTNHFSVANGLNSKAYINISGGTITAGYCDWGVGGVVNAYQSGGSFTPNSGRLVLGYGVTGGSGTSVYTMTGGTMTVGRLSVSGDFGGGGSVPAPGQDGIFSVLGGTLSVGGIYLGGGNAGTTNVVTGKLNIASDGLVNQGTSTSLLGGKVGVTGVVNLAGGTLATAGITGGLGTSSIALSGGTIKYTNSNSNWMKDLTNAYVFPGGVTINSQNNTGTISQALTGAAGNGVASVTLVDPGTDYLAQPTVSFTGGTPIGGNEAEAVATWDQATHTITGIVIVNPGQYSIVPTGVVLTGGGASVATMASFTTGSNAGGGLTKQGTGKLTLSETNSYTGNTIIEAGILSISSPYLSDASAVKITFGGKLDLNFAAEDTISELWLDGTKVGAGTYNSNHLEYGSYFTGTGSLLVPKTDLQGDTDDNGVVDAADFITLKKNFGAGVDGGVGVGNFDGAGTVDWADLSTLMTNMGVGSTAPATTPEPATLGLLAIGALAVIRRNRRS